MAHTMTPIQKVDTGVVGILLRRINKAKPSILTVAMDEKKERFW